MSGTILGRAEQIFEWMFGDLSEFLYKPHTLTLIGLLIIILSYAAFFRIPEDELSNRRMGLAMCSLFFIVYGGLQFPTEKLVMKPHPIIWKMAHGKK